MWYLLIYGDIAITIDVDYAITKGSMIMHMESLVCNLKSDASDCHVITIPLPLFNPSNNKQAGLHHSISSDLEGSLNSTSSHATHDHSPENSNPNGKDLDLSSSTSSSREGSSDNDPDYLTNVTDISPNEGSSGVNASVVVTVVAVLALAVVIVIGVLKENKYTRIKGWRLMYSLKRDPNADIKPRGTTIRRERAENAVPVKTKTKKKKKTTPYSRLQSMLGPSKLGFSRLRAYDSDSEEEEFPVFNRV